MGRESSDERKDLMKLTSDMVMRCRVHGGCVFR